jgi:ferric-dicitrate binding protein FerR (iron transport regulator)
MTNHDDLLLRWREGTLREEELRALSAWLDDPANRARLVEDAFLDEAILDALKTGRAMNGAARDEGRRFKVSNIVELFHGYFSWGKVAAGLALLLGMGIFGSWLAGKPERILATISTSGKVVIQRGMEFLEPAKVVDLQAGDLIKTAVGGNATLSYPEESTTLELKEDSELKLMTGKKGKRLELIRGKVEARVAKQPIDRPMVLDTPQAEATVVGTRFVLDARRTSTWLEMAEGAVDLARIPEAGTRGNGGQKIKVVAGQYAVVARGLELLARPITREANPGNPAPVKVDLFSFFDEGATWLVSEEEIRQTKIASTLRPFKTPHLDGHLVFQTDVQVNESKAGNEEWGFALQVRFGQGWPSNQVIRIRGIQNGPNGNGFQIVDSISKRSNVAPFFCEQGRVYHVKLDANPEPGKRVTHLSGKIWEGEREPVNWSIEMDAPFAGPLYDVALETIRSACTFTQLKSGLIE